MSNQDQKWQQVKTKAKVKRIDQPKAQAAASIVADPAFAVLDKEWQEHRKQQEIAEHAGVDHSSDDGSGHASSTEKHVNGQANGHGSPHAVAQKNKKPKVKKVAKPSVRDVACKLVHDQALQSALHIMSTKYADDKVARCEALAAYLLDEFSVCEVPFNKLLQTSPVEAADTPRSQLPQEFVQPVHAYLEAAGLGAIGTFSKQLLDALMDGQPDVLNGKIAPPKPKVGILVLFSLLLEAFPSALIAASGAIQAGGNKYASAGRLPLLFWTLSQAKRSSLAACAATWTRALLPQVLHAIGPVASAPAGAPHGAPRLSNASLEALLVYADEHLLTPAGQLAKAARPGVPVAPAEVPGHAGTEVAGSLSTPTSEHVSIMPAATLDALLRLQAEQGSSTKALHPLVAALEQQYPAWRQVCQSSDPRTLCFPSLLRLTLESAGLVHNAEPVVANKVVGQAALVVVGCLDSDDACFGAWENRHKQSLKGSSAVLQMLASRPSLLKSLRGSKKKSMRLDAMLQELQQRHKAALGAGKGWQGAAARTSQAACVSLLRGRRVVKQGPSGPASVPAAPSAAMVLSTLSFLATVLALAGVMAVVHNAELQAKAREMFGDEPVSQLMTGAQWVKVHAGPYAQQALRTLSIYADKVSLAAHSAWEPLQPHVEQLVATARPQMERLLAAAAPYMRQVTAQLREVAVKLQGLAKVPQ